MASAPEPHKNILLVEDDALTRDTLALLLEGQGYHVARAGDGREALDHLREQPPPDLILLDLMMPTLSGWEFREIQRRNPALASVPVVVLSALTRTAAKSTDLGEVVYLQKPVESDELLSVVRRCTAESGS